MAGSSVLDPTTIAELRKASADFGNPLLVRQLVNIYRTNAPRRIAQLRNAIAAGDAKTVGLVAHTLRTNCAMLGATAMAARCTTLEAYGERAALTDAAAVLAEAEVEFEKVLAALERLLTEEPEPPVPSP
jgi:HPt (histidine-containing phosphotransfer) domain-containing protein